MVEPERPQITYYNAYEKQGYVHAFTIPHARKHALTLLNITLYVHCLFCYTLKPFTSLRHFDKQSCAFGCDYSLAQICMCLIGC
jgi:hypothetical protein